MLSFELIEPIAMTDRNAKMLATPAAFTGSGVVLVLVVVGAMR
jgi:hypothetical protein